MQRCVGCRRHVAVHEHECPFCHAKLGLVSGTTVALVVAISVMTFGCSDRIVADGQESGADSTGSTDDTNATSVSTTATTTSATTNTTTDTPTTTFTTSEDTSTTEIETDPTSAGFIYGAPDGGGVSIECDVWAQDCPEDQKCMPWANDGGETLNATRCSPIGPNEVGDPCLVEGSAVSGVDNCELGAVCFGVDPETLEGTCVAQCTGSEASPQCEGDASCFVVESVINFCLPTCMPLAPGCAMNEVCAPWEDTFFCLPDGSFDEGQYGDACIGINACDPGLFCANAEVVPQCTGDTCCTQYCDITMPNPDMQCPGTVDGQQCIAWYADGEAPAGYENLGACLLPA